MRGSTDVAPMRHRTRAHRRFGQPAARQEDGSDAVAAALTGGRPSCLRTSNTTANQVTAGSRGTRHPRFPSGPRPHGPALERLRARVHSPRASVLGTVADEMSPLENRHDREHAEPFPRRSARTRTAMRAGLIAARTSGIDAEGARATNTGATDVRRRRDAPPATRPALVLATSGADTEESLAARLRGRTHR